MHVLILQAVADKDAVGLIRKLRRQFANGSCVIRLQTDTDVDMLFFR